MNANTTHDDRQFDLTVPAGWTVLDGYAGSVVAFASGDVAGRERFVPNVNVVRCANERALTLHELLDESIQGLAAHLTAFVLIERSDADARLRFRYRHGNLGLRADQRYVLDRGKCFVVTATALVAGAAECSRTMEAMIESFALDGRDAAAGRVTGWRGAVRLAQPGESA